MKKLIFIFFIITSNLAVSQEICDNGIDDDFDGLIDLNDTTDCSCSLSISSNDTGTVASLIPNPSFENRTCCPTSLGQLNCADTWQQASSATSDYFHTCGRTSLFTAPPNPLPDGDGYVGFYNGSGSGGGNYKEYIGACLLDTMFAGTSYQIQFFMAQASGDMNASIAIYGSNNCANLPFGGANAQYGCPSNGPQWDAMDSTLVMLSATAWTLVTLNFVPTQDITAIVLGGNCGLQANRNYYYVDNLLLNTTASFNAPVAGISSSGFYCARNMVLKSDFDSIPNAFQWYKDIIAVVGANDSLYNVPSGGVGNYQVRLMYDSGCVITDVFVVDSSVIDFDFDTIGSCSAGIDLGQIEVNNARGGEAPYEYQIDANSFVLDSIFDSLAPANYTITVRDDKMCSVSKTVTVNSYQSPQAIFITDTVCLGVSTTFTNNSTGSIINYTWSFGDGTFGVQNTPTFQHLYANAGIYMVKLVAETAQGCEDSISIQVEVRDMPIADFTFANDCEQKTIQFTNTTTIGGGTNTNGLVWSWDFGNTNASTIKNPTQAYTTAGFYMVTLSVSSPGGCIADTTKQIEIYPNPQADFNVPVVCFGEVSQVNDLSSVSSGVINSWNYYLENVNYTVSNPMHQFSTSGAANVKLIVSTQNGCIDSITKPAIINPVPLASYDFNPNTLSIFQTEACFTNLSEGATTYFWDYGFLGNSSVLFEQCIEFPREVNGFYDVLLISTNQFGCTDIIVKTIEVQDEFLIYVPNTFSPDGDGINDIFEPIISGVSKIDFYVFNRWGDEIFYTDQLDKGWDGTHKNVKLSQEDTYVYRIIALDLNGKKHIRQGHVNLVK